MHPLRIEIDGRTITVDSPRIVRIGRSTDADVLLSGETVSRMHAELRPTDMGWILVDAGSQHGTYVDGQRITELRVTQPLTVFCGLQGSGARLLIAPAQEQSAPGAAATNEAPGGAAPVAHPQTSARAPAPAAQAPAPASAQAPRPNGGVTPGPGRPQAPPPFDPGLAVTMAVGSGSGSGAIPAGPMTGPDVLVRSQGREQRFRHPTLVTIGRHPDCTVVVNDPVTSRYHGRIDAIPGGWTYSNTSKDGTYVDGRKMNTVKLEDSMTLHLGHPVAGPEVTVTPVLAAHVAEQRIIRQGRQKRLRTLGAVAAAAVLVGAIVFGATQLGDDGTSNPPVAGGDQLTSSELDNAKMATVLIFVEGKTKSGGDATWSGSGSIITSDGMILTNAHVAAPEADGLAERYGPSNLLNPEFVQIALIKSTNDAPADPSYRARVIQADGHVDAAVLQIYATIDGGELPSGDLNLPTVPIGDSDELRTGDEVTILGFPGISQSAGVSVTRGVISTFVTDPQFDTDRAEIDTDARIAPGNSGGLAINNAGEIIGIPSALFALDDSPVASGRIRSINLVKPIIASAR